MKRAAIKTKLPLSAKATAELHLRAEAELGKPRLGQRKQKVAASAGKPGMDAQRLVHELEVHQVELEMQNSELQAERDKMEALLERYTDLYDFAPVGYFTLGTNYTILQVNLTGTRLVGIERAHLVGQLFGVLVAPGLRPELHAFLGRVFAGQTGLGGLGGLGGLAGDFVLLHKGQSSRAVSIEAHRSPSGQECRIAMMDITERRQVEDRVRLSEIRYRRLFEAAHDGVLLLDPGTRKITDANPYMTKLLGYPQEQLVGKELFEIGLLKDEAASQEMFRNLKKSHEVRYEDLPLESREGRHQEVEVVANLYQENEHSVIQCNIRDITERKLAEDILRRSEALFSTLIMQAPFGVYVVDHQLRLLQVNLKAQPIFCNVHPLIGRDFPEIHRILWTKRVSDPIMAHFRHTLKTGEVYTAPEFSARRRDTGVLECYEWQIQRVTLPTGEHGVMAFFQDITERKRAEGVQRNLDVMTASNAKLELEIVRRQVVEETLRKSEQHLSQLLQQARAMKNELRQLSHHILHVQEEERKRVSRELHDEIGQTLVGINVHLAGLSQDFPDSRQQFQRKISQTRKLVAKSVEVVHRFARELRPTVLDDLGLIPALLAFLKEFNKRTGVRTNLSAYAAIEKLSIAKRTVLYRVAYEALNNVAQHAEASRVTVSFEQSAGHVCMTIKDDGKAFPTEKTLPGKKSNRLGLLGMRERLEMVGGSFEIISAVGQGTSIVARIPLGRAISGRASTSQSPAGPGGLINESNL